MNSIDHQNFVEKAFTNFLMSWHAPSQPDTRYTRTEGGRQAWRQLQVFNVREETKCLNLFLCGDSRSVLEPSGFRDYQSTINYFPPEKTRLRGEIGESLLILKKSAPSVSQPIVIHSGLLSSIS